MEFLQLAPLLAYLAKVAPEEIIARQGCSLTLAADITLHLEWEPQQNTLSLYTPLMHVDGQDKAHLYAQLLTIHLFGKATQDTFFALHDTLEQIILFQTLALDTLSEQDFHQYLDQFVHQAEYWYPTLSQMATSPRLDLPYINPL